MRSRSPLLSMLLALPLVIGCQLGGGGESGPDDPPDDPLDDDEPTGLLCEAEMMVTGSVVRSGPEPGPDDGCVPWGVWTIDVTLVDEGECGGDVEFLPQYIYEVTGDVDTGTDVIYPADPTNDNISLKVTSAGGDCLGSFEHYSADGKKYVLLKPRFSADVIDGNAYFELWAENQL